MDKAIDVRFAVTPQYENLGRNRYSKATGIRVEAVACATASNRFDEIHLFGIGTKGTPTAGIRLVVPRADLANLRDALNEVLEQPQAATVPDAVAAAMDSEPGRLPDAVAAAWESENAGI